jgi:hypothetical protein
MTSEAPKQTEVKDKATPPTETQRIVDPLDLVRTEGIPEHPEELMSNPAVTPQMINQGGENLRSDLSEQE